MLPSAGPESDNVHGPTQTETDVDVGVTHIQSCFSYISPRTLRCRVSYIKNISQLIRRKAVYSRARIISAKKGATPALFRTWHSDGRSSGLSGISLATDCRGPQLPWFQKINQHFLADIFLSRPPEEDERKRVSPASSCQRQ
jgi:hypothetical protein